MNSNTTARESMVLYESAYKAINFLPDDKMKWEAIEGLMKFGFYDLEPESDNSLLKMIFTQAVPSMKTAKERYEKAVENGKKGGRPTKASTDEILEMKNKGMSNEEIATETGLTPEAVKKRIQRSAHKPNGQTEDGKGTKDEHVLEMSPCENYDDIEETLGNQEKQDEETKGTNLSVSDSVTVTGTDSYTSSYTDAENVPDELALMILKNWKGNSWKEIAKICNTNVDVVAAVTKKATEDKEYKSDLEWRCSSEYKENQSHKYRVITNPEQIAYCEQFAGLTWDDDEPLFEEEVI